MATRYEEDPLAFGADAYKIRGYEGVAWRVLGWQVEQFYEEFYDECWSCRGSGYDEDKDESCDKCGGTGKTCHQDTEPTDRRTGFVVARMIGDDRDHVLEVEALVPISREDYCGECGQIGCCHDGYDRECENCDGSGCPTCDPAVEANIQSAQDGGGQPDPEEA